MRTSFLCTYFIADDASNAVKIGQSFDIESRQRQLQTGNGNRLRLVLALPASSWSETALHARFVPSRIQGEWFLFSDEIRKFIADMIAEGA